MKRLSDLECAILGIVFKKSPCTSYAIAKEFFGSPSSYWRGSVGAVYPAVERLRRLGLLKRSKSVSLGRSCSLYGITAKGLAKLRQWLLPPLPAAAAAITFDPIRTRSFFLAALSAEEQQAFLEEAERASQGQIPSLRAECERYRRLGDWCSEQAQRGALYTMEGRLAWLRDFRQALESRGPARGKRRVNNHETASQMDR